MKAGPGRPALLVGIALAVILAVSPIALAAGGGGHGEGGGEHHAPGFDMAVVFQIINFLLLVALFVYLYKKKNGRAAFEKRSVEIQIEMEEAGEAKKKAEQQYLQYKARIDALDSEIRQLKEEAAAEAARERESILEEAARQADKIKRQAEMTAKHEIENAKRELRREAADLAAGMAVELLKKSITPEDQRNWVKGNIEKIGEMQ